MVKYRGFAKKRTELKKRLDAQPPEKRAYYKSELTRFGEYLKDNDDRNIVVTGMMAQESFSAIIKFFGNINNVKIMARRSDLVNDSSYRGTTRHFARREPDPY